MIVAKYNYKWREVNSKFHYEEGLQKGICSILYPSEFDDDKEIRAINFFKNLYDADKLLDIVSKLVLKHTEPFLNESSANDILKQEVLDCFPRADESLIKELQQCNFAESYICKLVRKELVSKYEIIKKYADFTFEDL